ncbi:FxsA family protein [Pseudoroseicyclus aestuarii]|uniref:UPF0716 protein FxsA n=1 Tax=Pseudoroseicyclus aestuarii TaxID=1795041 RepID=A0A318T2L1_9RHOB|nr:FxsA family protein [Pseudoroseicyclus aestuarii]PYE84454.1 UPF0716 protein FxsA [Pseudoroseicyclus aestuarii]
MYLLIAFLLVPLIEIGLFIQVGGAIGLWPTLAIVVLTALAGTILVRREGMDALARLRGAMQELKDPSRPLADGAMILFAGALLLTPGFFTDACGFLLLIPGVRGRLYAQLRKRVKMQEFRVGGHPRQPYPGAGPQPGPNEPWRGPVVDADYEELPPREPGAGHSGWTKH